MGRNNPGHQANTGSRIAHVNDAIGFPQGANPDTSHMPGPVIIAINGRAKLAHGFCGCQYIFTFEQAGNFRFTNGKTAKHQGTMGN